MTVDPDPYRTLGVARGASLDQIKAAYRRLAKANHPDAAGEAALPRFLAIQAAYEQIVLSGPRAAAARRPRPSSADATRTDATNRAYSSRGSRPRSGPATGGTAGGAAGPGRRPAGGAAGTGTGSRGRGTGTAGPPGAAPGAGGTAGDKGATGASGTRRRNKATLGSTSYDDADSTPFEPDWGGASWYGTTSGTYWTLNPKEYADPRKHGPEYQARARRASQGRTARATPPDGAGPGAPTPGEASAAAAGQGIGAAAANGQTPRDGPTAPGGPAAGPTHTTSSWWESTAGPAGPPPDPATGAARPEHVKGDLPSASPHNQDAVVRRPGQ
jgi:Meckel syndrome type 1 protein